MTQTGYKIKGDATFEKNCPMEKAALETHPLGSFDQQRQPCLGSKVQVPCPCLYVRLSSNPSIQTGPQTGQIYGFHAPTEVISTP